VLVVDNASTDGSAEVARRCWPADASAALRVVSEPALGLSNARRRAFSSARYELVSFVDDDNWVDPDWAATAEGVMAEHPDAGACGGQVSAALSAPAPGWFARYQESYAVGRQSNVDGPVPDSRGYLWGAGLTVRKSAWEQLRAAGFRWLCTDRRGRRLSSGGDSELCFALRLAGWQLWYSERLRLQHSIPEHRLTWRYLRRLHRGVGASSVWPQLYFAALEAHPEHPRHDPRLGWSRRVLSSGKSLLRQASALTRRMDRAEREEAVLGLERTRGALTELLSQRAGYEAARRDVGRLSEWAAASRPSSRAQSILA
jgi:glycosyltransferase involved in cell wall biosynthesis